MPSRALFVSVFRAAGVRLCDAARLRPHPAEKGSGHAFEKCSTPMRWILAVWLGVSVLGCAGAGLAKRFQTHIDYLASDELQGRGLGSEGLEKAAQYVADQFSAIGLEPAGDDGSYFQTFNMTLRRKLEPDTFLAFEGASVPASLELKKDFIPFTFSSDDAFSGELIFCGYGIAAPGRQHDDFVHIDVRGKVALMLRGEPPDWADENGFSTPHAMFRNKVYNAKDRHAAAVILVNAEPREGEEDRLVPFDENSGEAYGLPAFHLRRAVADALLQGAGLPSLSELQKQMDGGTYVSRAVPGVTVKGRAVFRKETAPVRNVIGMLRGKGPLADEVVVVGAHYDHLGLRRPMHRRFKKGKIVREALEPQIHNGADDNASGTSGLIEVARALAARRPLKRSVLFIAFTAEESGLHGSTYYVNYPVVPLSDTVAMINMDMIGRMKPGTNRVQIFGMGTGDTFQSIVEKAARGVALDVAPGVDAGGRSDHAAFVRKNIPSLHVFTGQHPDYHQPTDDADRINAADGARVVRLVSRVTEALASDTRAPRFQQEKAAQAPASPSGTPVYRVVMGLSPGYGDDGKAGMRVEAVSPEGPADLAGMKAGDRIIRIEDKTVNNIYDYMAATRNNNPGDTVTVVVIRDGKEVSLKVTLAAAR
ncbi:MAG: M28 family peptidase [Planctomycetota bacterium]|nr:MAG: M28 family peptidase [Planctomycetota bacterium]